MITLPKLDYSYTSLEPFIDAATMEIHYTKHHQAYIDKANAVLGQHSGLSKKDPVSLLRDLQGLTLDEKDKTVLRNNLGGHVNHALYWQIMGPEKQVDRDLSGRIVQSFGSIDAFRARFEEAALGQFGSGWAWLVEKPDRSLVVYSTANQDSPYLTGDKPVFGIDVWEHAYYLKYQNRRAEYVKNWWNVLKLL